MRTSTKADRHTIKPPPDHGDATAADAIDPVGDDAQAPTLTPADLLSSGSASSGLGSSGSGLDQSQAATPNAAPSNAATPNVAPANVAPEKAERLAAAKRELEEIGDPYARRSELGIQRAALIKEAHDSAKAYELRLTQVQADYVKECDRAAMAEAQRCRLLQEVRRLERELASA